MARGFSDVALVGALVDAPELRYTPSGLALCNATLAGRDEVEGRELTWYQRVTLFGKGAEHFAEGAAAGDVVLVLGRLSYRAWDDPQGGGKRSAVEVNAQRAEILEPGPRPASFPTDQKGQRLLPNALNVVRAVGNLTRDAELRYTPSGTALCNLQLAINEYTKDGQEKVHFVGATVWRELAEACAELGKGAPVYLEGRLVNDRWTDRDGRTRYTTKIDVRRAEIIRRPAPTANRAGMSPAPSGANRSAPGLDAFPPEEDLPF